MRITCNAFQDGAPIDPRHSCMGENLSPALEWAELPAGTKSLALLLEDPDIPGGIFLHWLLYALDPSSGGLPEGLAHGNVVPGLGRQGLNHFGNTGYDGPCPPPGNPHRYFLSLYALDILPGQPGGTRLEQIRPLLKDHSLDQAVTHGTFKRG